MTWASWIKGSCAFKDHVSNYCSVTTAAELIQDFQLLFWSTYMGKGERERMSSRMSGRAEHAGTHGKGMGVCSRDCWGLGSSTKEVGCKTLQQWLRISQWLQWKNKQPNSRTSNSIYLMDTVESLVGWKVLTSWKEVRLPALQNLCQNARPWSGRE